jgi:exopolyphosphatase/guanosine-5'-triphosphate,3'-diphosphate pyrophosphatase
VRSLVRHIDEVLERPLAAIDRARPSKVIATSGSATTLLRIARQTYPKAVTGTEVPRGVLRSILNDMEGVTTAELVRRFGLDPQRALYFPTALLCLERVLAGSRSRGLSVCPVALREGVIHDFLQRTRSPGTPRNRSGDIRFDGVMDLAGRCDYPREHSRHVARLAVAIFGQTREVHGLGDEEERLLEYAAILHDIGYHIGYARHHKHGYYLIMNGDLRGLNAGEREILAHVVRYHRRAAPKKSHAPFAALDPGARRLVRRLVAILRIADALDRSHFSVAEDVRCKVVGRHVRFEILTRPGFPQVRLDLAAVKTHARFFEKTFGVTAAFVVRRIHGADARAPALPAAEEAS